MRLLRPRLRALGVVLRLAASRSRASPARWLAAAAGIAAAVALLGVATGGGTVAGERSARNLLNRLPDSTRSVRVGWSGALAPGVERRSRRALRTLTPERQTSSVLLLSTLAGTRPTHTVQVAGIAPLRRWVRLRSGRLPRTCTATRCEVLAAGGPVVPATLRRSATTLVTVGMGTLTSAVPLGFVPAPAAGAATGARAPAALLLSGDPVAVDALTGFSTTFRSHAWSAPLSTAVRSWGLGALQDRITRAANALTARDASSSLQAPSQALAQAGRRAHEARRRVVLVGAGAAVALLAFAVLAAGALGRDLADEQDRLQRRGARPWQAGTLALAECAWPALAGCAAGAGVAVSVTALRAHAAGLDAGGVLTHSLLTGSGVAGLAGCAVVTIAVLVAGARRWGPAAGPVADAVAVAAAVALALVLARGGARTDSGGDPLPALLVPLACLTAGLVVARLAPRVLRALERRGRHTGLSTRLALLALARAPATPAVTIAVIAVSGGLALFAAAYGATLRASERDQAAFAVPAAVTVRTGTSFVTPLAAAPLSRWRRLTGGGPVLAVQRTSADVPRGASRVSLPLLGVPAAAASRALAPRPSAPLRGPVVPAGARELSLRASTTGDGLDVTADLIAADGSTVQLALGTTGPRVRTLRRPLPAAATGRRLLALEVAPGAAELATRGHQEAEGTSAPATDHGLLRVGALTIGGQPVPLTGWVARGPLSAPKADGGDLVVPYAFDRQGRALLRPRQALDGRAIPVLTDPETARSAARGGVLPIEVRGTPLRARVVGTVRRFATVPADAGGLLIADEPTLRAALSADAPGSARPDELWLHPRGRAGEQRVLRALTRPPLSQLDHRSRRAAERALRTDPLSRELTRTLAAAALVALLLAVTGIALATLGGLGDDRAAREDLEALGVSPATLRGDVRRRAAVTTALGAGAGLVLGAALLALIVGAIQVTATGAAPQPPITATVPWAIWLAGAAAFAAVVAAITVLITRSERPAA